MLFCFFQVFAQSRDFTRHVNPFIGTGGHGHTFPGATLPHGMVQLSPDTRLDDWDGSGGYHYSDSVIYGFSHTHLSGTGIPDYCDVLFMPTVGEPQFSAKAGEKSENGYASKFSHRNEKAEPGYYAVRLDDDNIFAEMTATTRVGFHRYTFPESDAANIILDLKWRDKVLDAQFKISGRNRIEGYRRSSSWAKDQIVYFVAEFSKPFRVVKVENDQGKESDEREILAADSETLKTRKAAFRFKTKAGEQILLKVAVSPVSVEGARKNLRAELPHWNFERVRRDAKAAWNRELASIEVAGGTEAQLTNFYTALYHTKIHPNIFQDVDGRYRGLDGKTHSDDLKSQISNLKSPSWQTTNPKSKIRNPKSNYTVFSLWDTFRAAHPLYTIIDQRRTVDFINTFIRQYEQGGRLPVWELAGNETDTMIGYHAVSVIADAMAKRIEGFDYEKAYRAAKHSAELDHFGLEAYKRRGYISMEDEQESVSKTLEYAYNDYCIAQMALLLAEQYPSDSGYGTSDHVVEKFKEYRKYTRRARYWENLFDAETGFMRPKQNGGFVKPFQPNEVTFHFTEGNSWQYSFFVPHDVTRLMELHGGAAEFARKLDELFTTEQKLAGREQPDITGLIGQYAHGNEPSHHIAYLYNYAGEPWKTQEYVRRILDEFYKPTPDGLIGNEDCGQMSAWYVFSAAGFYPVVPGNPVYDLGAPLFREVKFNLENGKTFVVRAPNVSARNVYVKSVRLNGVPHPGSFIGHEDVMKGGVLEFEMSPVPVRAAFQTLSKSGTSRSLVAVPLIEGAERVFKGRNTIALKTTTPGAKILYSLDGGEPRAEYSRPFTIDRTGVVRAVTVDSDGEKSLPAEARFYKKPNDWTVKLFSTYNRQYTGGGAEGLVDGIRGTTNFASGEWQGYQGQDFVAVIDLQKEQTVRRVGGGFLQVARSWIWMPTRVEFEASTDGARFTKIAEIRSDVPTDDMEHRIRDYSAETAGGPVRARYVRVRATNLGKIPAWHPGAGFEAFIFVDEIFIQ